MDGAPVRFQFRSDTAWLDALIPWVGEDPDRIRWADEVMHAARQSGPSTHEERTRMLFERTRLLETLDRIERAADADAATAIRAALVLVNECYENLPDGSGVGGVDVSAIIKLSVTVRAALALSGGGS